MSSVNATGSTGLDAIARELVTRFDRNKDGQLSTEEFVSALNDVLNRATSSTNAASSNASSSSSSSSTRRTDHLSGFAASKLDAHPTTKYKFARAAMQFDLASVRDKTSAEALLKDMKPAMEREGLEVLEISKDKIKVKHDGQAIWVDVIRNSSTGINTAFQWLPDEV